MTQRRVGGELGLGAVGVGATARDRGDAVAPEPQVRVARQEQRPRRAVVDPHRIVAEEAIARAGQRRRQRRLAGARGPEERRGGAGGEFDAAAMKHQVAPARLGERMDLVAQQLLDDRVVDAGAGKGDDRAAVGGEIEVGAAGEADRRAAFAAVEQRREGSVGEGPAMKRFGVNRRLGARRGFDGGDQAANGV